MAFKYRYNYASPDWYTEYEQIEKDENRTDNLKAMGFNVVRYANEEICRGIEGVLNDIKEQLYNNNHE